MTMHVVQTGEIRAIVARTASPEYGPDGNEVRPFFLQLAWWACGPCEVWGCHDTFVERDEAIKRHIAA